MVYHLSFNDFFCNTTTWNKQSHDVYLDTNVYSTQNINNKSLREYDTENHTKKQSNADYE